MASGGWTPLGKSIPLPTHFNYWGRALADPPKVYAYGLTISLISLWELILFCEYDVRIQKQGRVTGQRLALNSAAQCTRDLSVTIQDSTIIHRRRSCLQRRQC